MIVIPVCFLREKKRSFPKLVVSIIRGKHLKVAISFIYLICALKYLLVLSYSIMIISAKRCSTYSYHMVIPFFVLFYQNYVKNQ